jgi:hypothetical protein
VPIARYAQREASSTALSAAWRSSMGVEVDMPAGAAWVTSGRVMPHAFSDSMTACSCCANASLG